MLMRLGENARAYKLLKKRIIPEIAAQSAVHAYASAVSKKYGAPGLDSNCRPADYKSAALPLSYEGIMAAPARRGYPRNRREFGSPGWARTSDILINSQTLYQLSYWETGPSPSGSARKPLARSGAIKGGGATVNRPVVTNGRRDHEEAAITWRSMSPLPTPPQLHLQLLQTLPRGHSSR